MKGRLTSVDCAVDSSIFAFSAASFRRWSASLSPRRSMPSSFLKPSARYSTSLLSKSSPRSEEHTSELQSLMRISYAVFCLKQKKTNTNTVEMHQIHKNTHIVQ